MESLREEIKRKYFSFSWIVFIFAFICSILSFIIFPLWISGILFLFIFLPVMLFILIIKWIKKGFAATLFTFSVWLNILILIVPLLGGLAALDLMSFSKDFTNNPKYAVLENNSEFTFGMGFLGQSLEQYSILTQPELKELKKEVTNKKVKDKTLFVVNKEVFRDINVVSIKEMGAEIQKDKIFELLESEKPIKTLIDILPETRTQNLATEVLKVQLTHQFGNESQIKAAAAMFLIESTLEKEGPKYLIDELKNGNIKIYPERISLNILIKLLPTELVSNFLPEIAYPVSQSIN